MLFKLRVECALSSVIMDSSTVEKTWKVLINALSLCHSVLREGQHQSAV